MFFLADGDISRSLEGEDTLPERSSDITDRLALWELSDRSLRFSFFSLCFSASLPLSFPSLGGFSSHFSLFLCFPLCFFPPAATTGFTSGSTGGGGLGVRGPFFFPWPPLEDLAVADAEDDTEVFFSFFLEPEALGPLVCLGDPLDFLEEGEPLELERSGDVLDMIVVLVLVVGSSFLITMSSLFSIFSCSNFMSSRWIFCLFISRDNS